MQTDIDHIHAAHVRMYLKYLHEKLGWRSPPSPPRIDATVTRDAVNTQLTSKQPKNEYNIIYPIYYKNLANTLQHHAYTEYWLNSGK